MLNPRDVQLKYEEDSDDLAAAERCEYLRQQASTDADLPRANKFIARAYAGVRDSLDATMAVQTRGVGGKFKNWLRKVPSDVAAVIALRVCVSACSSKRGSVEATVSRVAVRIGRLYEVEVKLREAEAVNPLYMKRVYEQVKEHGTTSESHLRRLYETAYANVMKGGIDSSLSAAEALGLGKFGLQAVMDAGLIELRTGYNRGGTTHYYEFTPEAAEFLCDYNHTDVQHVLASTTGAMLCEPDPWTTSMDGGYLSARRKLVRPLLPMSGIRKSERGRLRREVYTVGTMPKVFQAANYLQSVPYRLHQPTLQAVLRLWRGGGGALGVPTQLPPSSPAFPFGENWIAESASEVEQAQFSAWKRARVRYYDDMRTWRGHHADISGFAKTTALLEGNADLWFPVFVDKRGRWYYRGSPNPQGSDITKAVLHFGRQKRLGSRGVFWLQVHIANCFGFDKVRFSERARWTVEHWPRIVQALDCPEDYPEVWGDSPWCMWSAAYELQQAYLSGAPEEYCTGIPVHMDATCSGLQHFAAILRDPIGGEFVNLVDGGQPEKQDIYARVAGNAMAAIKLDSEDSDHAKAAIALWWLKRGISRSLAKKPVMTYVYGATLNGTAEGVIQDVEMSDSPEWPVGVRPYDVANYAAKKLFQGIAMTVPAAEAGMRWLREVARSMPNGQRMEWTTPTGFRVQHDYQDFEEVRVWVRSCGVTKALVREYTEDTRALPMQNAIAPNFVHALDASHLTLTALQMEELGLDMVGIHDSFGTHPGDVDTMHRSIREAFVRLYTGSNVMADFLWEVGGSGSVPMRGTLQLSEVLKSEFFFC